MYEFMEHSSATVTGLVIACPFLLIGVGGIIHRWRRMRGCTETAQAEVFKIEEDNSGDGIIYRAWGRFRCGDDFYEVASSWGPTHNRHVVGKPMTVHFPPAHPEQAVISRWEMVLSFVAIFLIGITILVMTIYLSLV